MAIVAGAVNVAPFDGDVIVTDGALLTGDITATSTAGDVDVAPLSSCATAFSTCLPAGALVQITRNGLLVWVPISVESA